MMKTTLTFLTLLLCSISFSVYAQDEPKNEFNKNTILVSAGIGGLYFAGSVYYERIINQELSNISLFVRAGGGGYGAAFGGGSGVNFTAQFGILTGKKKHHLEMSLGPNYINEIDEGFFSGGYLKYLSGNIGWRIQKPSKHHVFRLGVGFPEALYVGYGFSF